MIPTIRWRVYANTGRDHLLVPKDQYNDGHEMTWCGIALDAPGRESGVRCKQCLNAIARYAAQAAAPPPEEITEVAIVTITRPVGAGESAADAIKRRMAPMKSWKVSIE